MNICELKALLECLPVDTLLAVNSAHWLKCDPGQHKKICKIAQASHKIPNLQTVKQ